MTYSFVLETAVEVDGAPEDYAVLDPIMAGRTGFFRYLVDTTYGRSYPGGAPEGRPAPGSPADGAILYDSCNIGNGHFRKGAGQTVNFQGGGFDLTQLTVRGGGYMEVPASVNADLFAAAPAGSDHVGESQAWAECAYFIMPDPRTWAGITSSVVYPILTSVAAGSSYYASNAERVWVGIKQDGTIEATFQQAIGSTPNTHFKTISLGLVNVLPHVGQIMQLLVYRKRDGTFGARIKTPVGTYAPATVSTTANTADYSALPTKLGIVPSTFWPASGIDIHASPFSLFRHWIGNLSRQEIDPIALADEDYADMIAVKTADPTLYSAA
jgi:hypothetical protein